jgi:Na+-transporting NADH:ubiquinone oxidoreductase subunit NqrA
MLAQPGDEVLRGQPLYEDKSAGGVVFTAPATGRLEAVHRGERRAFISAVIAVADDDADPARQADLPQVRAAQSARLDRANVVAACASPACGPRCASGRSAAYPHRRRCRRRCS